MVVKLARIWAQHLGRNDLTVTDNFFDAGGHSLVGVRLVRAVEKAFGLHVPVSMLFEAPMIGSMSARLKVLIAKQSGAFDNGDRPMQKEVTSLQTLRDAARGTPVIAFPPLGNSALFFRPLLAFVDASVPVFSVAAENVPNVNSFEGFIDRVVLDVLERFPNGPYVLLGTCRGSHFAYAVGRQLRLAGQQVEVVVVDGECPRMGTPHFLDESSRLYFRIWQMFRNIAHLGIAYFQYKVQRAWRGFRDPAVRAQLHLQGQLFRMTEKYKAEAAPLKIVCIQSEEYRHSKTIDSHLGWERLALGGFESVVFSGSSHVDVAVASTPYLADIARTLTDSIERQRSQH